MFNRNYHSAASEAFAPADSACDNFRLISVGAALAASFLLILVGLVNIAIAIVNIALIVPISIIILRIIKQKNPNVLSAVKL